MPPSLDRRVQQVQRLAGRLVRIHGLAWFAAAAVAGLAGLAIVDYLLRLNDPAARWLISAAAAALVAAALQAGPALAAVPAKSGVGGAPD